MAEFARLISRNWTYGEITGLRYLARGLDVPRECNLALDTEQES